MEIREIRYLLQFVEDGTIAKAADSLCMTPQGLLKSLRATERAEGIRLLLNERGTLVPSETAIFLGQKAAPLLDELLIFEATVKDAKEPRNMSKNLLVGITQQYPRVRLPKLADISPAFQRANVARQLVNSTSEACISGVLSEVLDAALVIGEVHDSRITAKRVTSSLLYAATAREHPLAKLGRVSLAQIASFPIARPYDLRYGFKTTMEAFVNRDLHPHFVDIPPTVEAHTSFLESDNGIVFVNQNSSIATHNSLIALDQNELPAFDIFFIQLKNRPSEKVSAYLNAILLEAKGRQLSS